MPQDSEGLDAYAIVEFASEGDRDAGIASLSGVWAPLIGRALVCTKANQQNPEALFYNHNYSQSASVTGIPILPTLGVRGEW